jgi:hypothetical protein
MKKITVIILTLMLTINAFSEIPTPLHITWSGNRVNNGSGSFYCLSSSHICEHIVVRKIESTGAIVEATHLSGVGTPVPFSNYSFWEENGNPYFTFTEGAWTSEDWFGDISWDMFVEGE